MCLECQSQDNRPGNDGRVVAEDRQTPGHGTVAVAVTALESGTGTGTGRMHVKLFSLVEDGDDGDGDVRAHVDTVVRRVKGHGDTPLSPPSDSRLQAVRVS